MLHTFRKVHVVWITVHSYLQRVACSVDPGGQPGPLGAVVNAEDLIGWGRSGDGGSCMLGEGVKGCGERPGTAGEAKKYT